MALERSDCAYQAYYCEENIWHLSQRDDLDADERCVVFVSNPTRSVALWGQRAAQEPTLPLIWDYHVILLAHESAASRWLVYDLDTTLDFPLPADVYLQLTFAGAARWPAHFRPLFRVIPASSYRSFFGSDRSHMRDEEGHFRQPPPPWPPITGSQGNTLQRLIDMEQEEVGDVLTLDQLRQRFA